MKTATWLFTIGVESPLSRRAGRYCSWALGWRQAEWTDFGRRPEVKGPAVARERRSGKARSFRFAPRWRTARRYSIGPPTRTQPPTQDRLAMQALG